MALSVASNVYPYYYTEPQGPRPVYKHNIPLEPIRDRGHCLDGAHTLHDNIVLSGVVQTPPVGTSCSGCYYVSRDTAINVYFCDYDPNLDFCQT